MRPVTAQLFYKKSIRLAAYNQAEIGLIITLEADPDQPVDPEHIGEALAPAWAQVQAFIQSIDRSDPFGRRDFTLLYLAAAYGLRSCELVHLTLDDIDWRGRTLRIMQTKTRQALQLPLTDEAANVLIDYCGFR